MIDKDIVVAISKKLLSNGETIAVAESVTSGMLQVCLSNAPDASKFYQGGITAFNLGQKYKHLCIEPIHAASVNCVSDRVAAEMALNVCRLFNSNWGIGITGYATPVPESNNELYCYYAIAYKNDVKLAARLSADRLTPFEVQAYYAEYVLNELAKILNVS